jgi:TRAP-type C4-dicarboxylate transport system substrate-binding protein
MQDSRLASDPEAILIAAKMAYTDYTGNQTQQQLNQVSRENEKLKEQTMIEGGGRGYNKPSEDPFQSSMESLKRASGSDKRAGQDAVAAFLARRNASKK